MKQKILTRLLQQAGQPVSGAGLAETLGISRVMVHKHIDSLRQEGYRIEAIAGRGYCLYWPESEVNPSRVRSLVSGDFGSQLVWRPQVDSTQEAVLELVNQGLGSHGLVCVARQQKAGRGRRGRSWVSEPGGLCFSMLICTEIPMFEISRLSLLFSLAVAQALKPWCPEVKIKWPNDVMIGDRKLAGLLLNLQGEANGTSHIIIGLGVNVNGLPPELPGLHKQQAISLEAWRGEITPIDQLFAAILHSMESFYARYLHGDWDTIITEYRENCAHIGKVITVHQGEQVLTGTNTAITRDGSLQLLVDGQTVTLHSGDIL